MENQNAKSIGRFKCFQYRTQITARQTNQIYNYAETIIILKPLLTGTKKFAGDKYIKNVFALRQLKEKFNEREKFRK